MSGVYKRLRKETEMQFLINGLELQVEITKFVMKEKFVPKKWRIIIAQGIIAKVDEMVDNMTFANSIYPTSEQEFVLRRKYQTMAICNCYQLHNKIVRMEKCLDSVKIENLSKIIELLNQVVVLLKRWKKTDKIREN